MLHCIYAYFWCYTATVARKSIFLEKRPETEFHFQLLREECPNTEFFWSVFSRIQTEYGKIRTGKNPYLDIFLSRSECLRSASCLTKNSTHKSKTSLFSLQHSCILYISKYYLEYTRPINLTFSRPVGFGFFLSKGLKI